MKEERRVEREEGERGAARRATNGPEEREMDSPGTFAFHPLDPTYFNSFSLFLSRCSRRSSSSV